MENTLCAWKIQGKRPCKVKALSGCNVCRKHFRHRTLTPDEAKQLSAVKETLEALEPELAARFPAGMASHFILKLEEAALDAPSIAEWLAGLAEQPGESTQQTLSRWAERLHESVADALVRLGINDLIEKEGPPGSALQQAKHPRSASPDPLPPFLKFSADRILLGVIETFSTVDQMTAKDGWFRSREIISRRGDFAMLCGFQADPGEETWAFLQDRGAAAIKAHYALWARLYEQTGGELGRHAMMNISQFCSDLGYTPHHKGGFKRERKQEAMKLLEVLTTVEIAVRQMKPGTNKLVEVRGPLWERGLAARERDAYGDLLGHAREGDSSLWDPVGFTFGPGRWWANPEWRKQNEFLGLIGAGLMKLRADTDQTAIQIGGYLGALGRFEQYRSRRIRVTTLLPKIGMEKRYPKNPGKLQAKVEEAFNKLIEVAVISAWRYTDSAPDEPEPDMDDPEDLAGLAVYRSIPWRRKTIEVEWPEPLAHETKRLEAAQKAKRLEGKHAD